MYESLFRLLCLKGLSNFLSKAGSGHVSFVFPDREAHVEYLQGLDYNMGTVHELFVLTLPCILVKGILPW